MIAKGKNEDFRRHPQINSHRTNNVVFSTPTFLLLNVKPEVVVVCLSLDQLSKVPHGFNMEVQW